MKQARNLSYAGKKCVEYAFRHFFRRVWVLVEKPAVFPLVYDGKIKVIVMWPVGMHIWENSIMRGLGGTQNYRHIGKNDYQVHQDKKDDKANGYRCVFLWLYRHVQSYLNSWIKRSVCDLQEFAHTLHLLVFLK